MIREIIVPDNEILTMKIPSELVGKTVEIIAFEIEQNKPITSSDKLEQIDNLTKPFLKDLGDFKFKKDQATNYDE